MMGTTMDKSSCEWVRGRLPLWMGPGALNDPDDDGGDLSVEDGQAIERHLGSCPGCRAHQSGLSRAQQALAATAGSLSVAHDAPSLWPALERRIAVQHGFGGAQATRPQSTSDGSAPAWTLAILDDERPIRSAWMQDTLREMAETAGLAVLSDRMSGGRRGRAGRSPVGASGSWRVVVTSLAASIVALLIIVPTAWRKQSVAEATIRGNAAPLAMVGPADQAESQATDGNDFNREEDRGILDRQLARADLIPSPADPSPSPTADVAAGGKAPASSRLDYDLDPMTPMPPDGRDAKPVY
jgi:hypothetical protein